MNPEDEKWNRIARSLAWAFLGILGLVLIVYAFLTK